MNSVYTINKAVNRPIVFRGLRAQYIWYVAIGLVILLLLFALLYIAGVPITICLGFVVVSGILLFYYAYRFNKLYGEHGWMKQMASKRTPKRICADQLFTK